MTDDTIEVPADLFASMVEHAHIEYDRKVNEGANERFLERFEEELNRADDLLVEHYNA